ncbi:Chaperone DnaJ-domain superfamily protein [Striga hermonthica]|uniref:Chaperone DnaJ-domain superfamily protein n=1 Tax=Striga hermonthica TaxID=68872 RepID=A0A9N7N5E6_STRHE|nr:Chaperone DnaJ-domain superfamily protein [Striga hermonthica]
MDSFSRYTSGNCHKSAYDGVFGAQQKLSSLPPSTLAPRLDEYAEIFGGYQAAAASPPFSVFVLDLPLDDGSNKLLREFDYAEVFGDCEDVAFGSTIEDLVRQCSGGDRGYGSSDYGEDESWSPAQSGSVSDEFDGLAESDKSLRLSDDDGHLRLSDDDGHQSLENPTEHLNAFHNESSQSNTAAMLVGKSQVKNITALPGYTLTHYESPVSWDGEDESCSVSVLDDLDLDACKEYSRRVEKQCSTFPANSVHRGSSAPRSDLNHIEKHGNSASKPFLSVSEISLRTKPSRLPPPSRPPPALVLKKGESDRLRSKLNASKNASFSFDVEADVTLSPDVREDGNKNFQSKHERAKESLERKDIRSHCAMTAEEETSKGVRTSSIKDEKLLKSLGKETKVSIPYIEEKMSATRDTEDISGSYSNSSIDSCAGGVAWREETEYFEVIEKKVKVFKKDQGLEEEWPRLEMTSKQQKILKTTLHDPKGFREEVEPNKMAHQCDSHQAVPDSIQQFGDSGRLQKDLTVIVEVLQEADGNLSEVVVDAKVEADRNLSEVVVDGKVKVSPKGMDTEKVFIGDAILTKQNSVCQGGLDDVERAETKERVKLRKEPEGTKAASQVGFENETRKTHGPNENEMITKEAKKYEEHDKKLYRVVGLGKFENQHLTCEDEKDELTYRNAFHQVRDEKEEKMGLKIKVTEERSGDASRGHIAEVFQTKGHTNLTSAGALEEHSGHTEEIEDAERNEHEREVECDVDNHVVFEENQLKAFDCGRELDGAVATSGSGKHDDGIVQLKAEPNKSVYEAVSRVESTSVKGKSKGFGKSKNEFDGGSIGSATINTLESSLLPKKMKDLNIYASGMGIPCAMADNVSSDFAYGHERKKVVYTEDDQGLPSKGTQFTSKGADISDTFTPYKVMRESTTNGTNVEDASSVLKHNGDTSFSIKNSTHKIERKGYIMKENLDTKDQKTGERIRRDIELENEHIKRLEEEKERERERAKDRMAVGKADLESREKSYAEVHERAEKAAVDRATAEVRQRAMAGARQRLEKASTETKLRDERAAVERATAEARQRAAEKSMAQKFAAEGHVRVERPVSDRFQTSFRSADMRQNSLASDIRSESTGISNSLRYSYSFPHVGADGESPQRCKARLERYRRTAERAANALAEKNRRDLLAQREREEMNRVAETLDIEVKRWANGKEGNLRALLSTLQYILGPDSGWQPVPLTEVITSAAVKKAYRKATLCVHPDKLQQRGAAIQQKYICEKVFDLLKEAWNKFNSEER